MTWWQQWARLGIIGFTGNDDQFISAPKQVRVRVGVQHKVDLTVTVGSS